MRNNYYSQCPIIKPKYGQGWIADSVAIAELGIIGAWLLNEGGGSVATDLSGNGNNGTIPSGTAWTNGQWGSQLNCVQGQNQGLNVSMPAGASYLIGVGGPYSVSITYKPYIYYVGTGALLLSGQYGSFASSDYLSAQLSVNFGGDWRAHSDISGTHDIGFSRAAYGVQTTMVIAYDGANWASYINGVLDNTDTFSAVTYHPLYNWNFGDTTQNNGYGGSIDNIILANKCWSASTVATLYTKPFWWMQPPILGINKHRFMKTSSIINPSRSGFRRTNLDGCGNYYGIRPY